MSEIEEEDTLGMETEDDDIHEAVLLQIEGVETEKSPDIEKVRHFFATTVGGLEEVALQDMKRRLRAIDQVRVERRQRHARIFFYYERSPRKLLELRCVDNLFVLLAMIRGVTVGRPGLMRIAEQVARADLIPGIALHDTLHGLKPDPWFKLTCTGGRSHRFSASELHQVVKTVVEAKYGIPTEGEGMPYSLHLHLDGKNAVLGLQLSPRRMRDREYRVENVPGGLESTVGYCMAFLARVEKRDVCLDPMCGSGTTLLEAGIAFEPATLLGGDMQAQVLEAAQCCGRRGRCSSCALGCDTASAGYCVCG